VTLILLINDLNLSLQVILMDAGLLYLRVHPLYHDLESVDSLPRLVPLYNEPLVHLTLNRDLVTSEPIEYVILPLDLLVKDHLVKLLELICPLLLKKSPSIGLLHFCDFFCMLLEPLFEHRLRKLPLKDD
jgi:hypothetical protein